LPAGVPTLEGLDPQRPLVLPALDTPLNQAVRALLDEVRRQRGAYLRLRVVRRGDAALEQAFYAALVEDRSPAAGMSYVEYLCFLHRQIQNKLS
jgi:protein transport protein SEC24